MPGVGGEVGALRPYVAALLGAVVLLVFAWAPKAAAVPVPGGAPLALSPAGGQLVQAGASITFQVQAPSDAFSVWVVASASPAVGASGQLGSELAFGSASSTAPGLYSYQPPEYSPLYDHLGVVYWQAYLIDYRYDPDFYAEGPIQSFSFAESRGHLRGRAGVSNGKGYYINPGLIAAGVDPARFQELVQRSGARWELPFLGLAGTTPGVRDGVNTVGFGYGLAPGTLGVTITYLRPRIRVRRVCRVVKTPRGGRKRICRGVRYTAGRVKTGERDIVLSMGVLWEDGPRRPSTSYYDLESTIVHEFGHFAGNAAHVFGCVNSPMIGAIGRGDYWRDYDQVALRVCQR